MQKITTNLWFDDQAKEAARFYTGVFRGSKIKSASQIHGTPSGSVDILTIDLWGREFMLISAGPLFKFNPSVSFLVACKTKKEVELLWRKLSKGGKALMELGFYPFSEWYGWIQDKYGLSWQIMSFGKQKFKQRITPVLMFTRSVAGKAGEAMKFYASVFPASKVGDIMRFGPGQEPNKEGTVAHGSFTISGEGFAAMDGAGPHEFFFNEAISFIVHCRDQKEIDYYWKKLSAVKASEQCGWLKDKYGLSWQVVPTEMEKMMKTKDKKALDRVTKAFLEMKKYDVKALKKAYEGKA